MNIKKRNKESKLKKAEVKIKLIDHIVRKVRITQKLMANKTIKKQNNNKIKF